MLSPNKTNISNNKKRIENKIFSLNKLQMTKQ